MKRTTLVIMVALFVLVALVLSGCYGSSATPTKPAATPPASGSTGGESTGATAVSISNFAFDPASVTVKVGGTVTWTNNDSPTHTITGDGGLDSGDVANGGTYSKTFDKAGTYKYHCTIHPNMTGEVIVQ